VKTITALLELATATGQHGYSTIHGFDEKNSCNCQC